MKGLTNLVVAFAVTFPIVCFLFSYWFAPSPYNTPETFICESWSRASVDETDIEYWNIQPVNINPLIKEGKPIYILAKVKDINRDHSWKIEVYHKGELVFSYVGPWFDVASGWNYSNSFIEFYFIPGKSYLVKTWLNIGDGYEHFSEINIPANNQISAPLKILMVNNQ